MVKIGPADFNPVGQNKAALKGAACDATVQINPLARIFGLTAPHDQLAVFDRDLQIILAKTCDGQGDAVGGFRGGFDVEGGIPLTRGLGGAFDQAFQLFKA